RRVDVFGAEEVQPVGVRVGHRQGCVGGQLPLDGDRRLQDVGARRRELTCWITWVDWKPASVAGDGTLGKKSGLGTTSCCCTSPLKRCAASVLARGKRS